MAIRHKLTYDDYLLYLDDGLRRELIDGEIYVTPSPLVRHQVIVGRLYWEIEQHLRAHGGGRVLLAPCDVVLSDHNVVEPDLLFVSSDDAGIITERNIQGPPTLVIEVLSDPARDRRLKRDLYASFSVPEYWIVDPDAQRVEEYSLAEGIYPKPSILETGDKLTTDSLPGLVIEVSELLRS